MSLGSVFAVVNSTESVLGCFYVFLLLALADILEEPHLINANMSNAQPTFHLLCVVSVGIFFFFTRIRCSKHH